MRSVIQRVRTIVTKAGFLRHIDRPTTYAHAEQLCGHRLDHRKRYAIIKRTVCELATWSQACSGCYVGMNSDHELGIGCHECGYQGRVRRSVWVPVPTLINGKWVVTFKNLPAM